MSKANGSRDGRRKYLKETVYLEGRGLFTEQARFEKQLIWALKDQIRDMFLANRHQEYIIQEFKKKIHDLYMGNYDRNEYRYHRNRHREESEAADEGQGLGVAVARPDVCEQPAEVMVQRPGRLDEVEPAPCGAPLFHEV